MIHEHPHPTFEAVPACFSLGELFDSRSNQRIISGLACAHAALFLHLAKPARFPSFERSKGWQWLNPFSDYEVDAIRVLKGIDPVRERPEMFIGNVNDGTGVHNMVYEVVENAVDEALAVHGREVIVVLNPDGSCTVRDNGLGMPTDVDEKGEFAFVGSLQAIGVWVVCALSTFFKITIWRDGKEHFTEFRDGETVVPLAVVGDAPGKHGTEVTFLPSKRTFSSTEFDVATLDRLLHANAVIKSGVALVLSDMRAI